MCKALGRNDVQTTKVVVLMVNAAGEVAREQEGERLENKVEGLTKRDAGRVNWPRLGIRD